MGYMGLRVDEELEDVVPLFSQRTAIFSVPAPGRELPEELPVPRNWFLGSLADYLLADYLLAE